MFSSSYKIKKPSSKEEGVLLSSLLICQSTIALQELAPCFLKRKSVAGYHRASPSTTLDKKSIIHLIYG